MIVSADKKGRPDVIAGASEDNDTIQYRWCRADFSCGIITPPLSPAAPIPDRLDLGQHAPGAPARVWFYPVTWHSPENYGYTLPDNLTEPETKMTKLTLQEQMLKAGLVTNKKMAKVQRTAKKSRVQAREAREAVEEKKQAQLERDKQLSEQQKQATIAKEIKAQVKQLIEMNRISLKRGDIDFNFTDGSVIKKITVDKLTQNQLVNGRLAIARLAVDNGGHGEYAIIPASVADKIAQRDAGSIVLNSTLSQEAQDEDDPYADFKVPDDLMW